MILVEAEVVVDAVVVLNIIEHLCNELHDDDEVVFVVDDEEVHEEVE